MPPVIDEGTVRHVARLARLHLEPDELERMRAELSSILEHVDRIQAIDLEGVPPTTHVEELENVLRDDEPRPSLTRRGGPARGARGRRRRLRRRAALAGVAELHQLSAEEALGALAAGETSSRELVDAALARAEDDRWHSFLALDAEAARARADGSTPFRSGRRSAGCRSRSRTRSPRATCSPRRGRGSSRATARSTPPPASSGSSAPARW